MIKNLSKPFKWFFQLEAASGLVLLIAAIVTPPDVVSQIIVAIPMLLIYEASIFISVFVHKNKLKENV